MQRADTAPSTRRVLLVTPTSPAERGNGLAMRAGLLLEALAVDYEASLLVVPVAGRALGQWSRFIRDHTTERVRLRPRHSRDSAVPDAHHPPTDAHSAAALRSSLLPFLSRLATDEHVEAARRAFSRQATFDAVVVMGLYLAPFVAAFRGPSAGSPTTIVDMVDDEFTTRRRFSALYAQLGERSLSDMEAMEADKYRILEAAWLPVVDHALVSSEHDRAAVAARTGHPPIHVVPNGVRVPERPPIHTTAADECFRVVFVGSLSYFPNVDAATVLCREVLPLLRTRVSRGVRVDLVGIRPAPAIRDLGTIEGVTVHADVRDVAPFYRQADAVVVPIRAGGGTRLKILEAFAHGVPVVSTAIGAEGIEVVPGRHLLIADDPVQLADACQRLSVHPDLAEQLRTEAGHLVAAKYDVRHVARGIGTLMREWTSPQTGDD